jgi:hypothetical protein
VPLTATFFAVGSTLARWLLINGVAVSEPVGSV